MLVKDLIAQGTLHKTVDLLENMMNVLEPKKRRDDVMVRAYVVNAHYRKRPRHLRLVGSGRDLALAQRRRRLSRAADRLLANKAQTS